MTLLLVVVGAGLVLGVLAAVLTAPLRGGGRIVAVPLPGAAGAAARAGAAGAGGAGGEAAANGAGPGGGVAAQNGAGGAAGGPGAGSGPAGQGGQGGGAGGQNGGGRGAGGQGGGQGAGGQGAGGRAGAAGAGGAAGGGAAGAAANRTNGVIQSIVDGTMVVSTPDGPVHVTLGDNTSVERLEPAAPQDLAPGQRVVVSGARGGDGAVTASGVQIVGNQEGGPERGQGATPGGQGTNSQANSP
jgi:hypothetical protein